MKSDLYTKAVLTVIALAVVALAVNQYISPRTTALAQAGQFSGVQFSAQSEGFGLFDARTGDVWFYQGEGTGKP